MPSRPCSAYVVPLCLTCALLPITAFYCVAAHYY